MITWTPDGSAIVFARSGGGVAGGLHTVTIADGTVKSIGLGGTHPVYSAKGDQIAYLSNGAAVAPAIGGQAKNLTQPIDRGIARALWMPDGKSLIVGGNDTERVSLWQQPIDGPAKKLDTGDASPNSAFFVDMAVSSTGAIAFTGTAPTRPGELYLKTSPDAPVKRLTGVNDEIASLPLGKSEVVSYTFEKFAQNGILTYPPDFDPSKKYPLVLLVHGGPRAASLMTFSAGAQLMAARGWLVFQPNYRGSDNLGRAFQGAIQNDAGAGPGRDVMAGIETIKQRGIVDESKMAVSGWSYGGYMTTWLIGHTDRFACAVAARGVYNLLTEHSTSDAHELIEFEFDGYPWDMHDKLWQHSPLAHAHRISTPLLILHSEQDYRVPISEAEQLFSVLRRRKQVVEFIRYPRESHELTRSGEPRHRADHMDRTLAWFDRYCKPGEGR